jgi:O-antigen ligase
MRAMSSDFTVDAVPGRSARLALRILQIGGVAVVLVVTTLHAFELDRFFVPKELALHVTALLAGILAARAAGERVDRFLSLYLLLGALSALFATNRWLAMRALAISASSVLLFWAARRLRDAGLARALTSGLAFAVIVTAATSLLQTYGLDIDFFSEQRAPGGTLGNRNFIAHVAAFGFPMLLLTALRARRALFWSIGAALVVATLVLTRSRAAWLAFAAVLFVFLVALLASGPLRRDGRTWRRLGGIVLLTGGAVAAVVVLPNALRWRSDNPYLESVKRVADYQGGSGRGRLVQYEHSLNMALHHPLLGVGPGNWSVAYPGYAPASDPSMNDSDAGMTFNPWPSSDWIAAVAERGAAAAILLGLVFLTLAVRGFAQLRRAIDAGEALAAAALLGTIAGALVTGLFDAVLLLAVPAFLVWTALGALSPPDAIPARPGRAWITVLVIVACAIGAARSASQLIAMQIYATRGDRASLLRAAKIDPGNYRLQLRLARALPRRQRCEHALAAHELYPHAAAGRADARGCE